MGQTETDGGHIGHELQLLHPFWCISYERGDDDDQFIFIGCHFSDVVYESHMGRQRALQIVGSFVAYIEQQGGRLTVDEGEDNAIHVFSVNVACYGPTELAVERVKCPESAVIALCRHYRMCTQRPGHLLGELVGSTYVSGEHRDHIHSVAIYADHGGIRMLILDIGSYGAYANPQGTDEDEGIVVVPHAPDFRSCYGLCVQFLTDDLGNLGTGFVYTDNGSFHRQIFIISIGL